MIAIIVAIDQFIWRPLIAWSDKFKFEQVESSQHVRSPLLHSAHPLEALAAIARHTTEPLHEAIYIKLAERGSEQLARLAAHPQAHEGAAERWCCGCCWRCGRGHPDRGAACGNAGAAGRWRAVS